MEYNQDLSRNNRVNVKKGSGVSQEKKFIFANSANITKNIKKACTIKRVFLNRIKKNKITEKIMGVVLDFAPLVRKYTWNKSEDVRAEAWLAVVEATKLYDSTKGIPFAGYVKSKVKYSVWNMVRKQQRQWQYEVAIENDVNNEENSLIDTLQSSVNVSDEVEQKFLTEELQAAINMLPERQRIAVIKTVFCNFSQTETAATLGVTPQAIFNLRNRGLARLKKAACMNIYN